MHRKGGGGEIKKNGLEHSGPNPALFGTLSCPAAALCCRPGQTRKVRMGHLVEPPRPLAPGTSRRQVWTGDISPVPLVAAEGLRVFRVQGQMTGQITAST